MCIARAFNARAECCVSVGEICELGWMGKTVKCGAAQALTFLVLPRPDLRPPRFLRQRNFPPCSSAQSVPRRDDAGATAPPPFSFPKTLRAASTCRNWLAKLVFSVRSSATILSIPVMFAMAGIIAEVLSTCDQDRRRSLLPTISQRGQVQGHFDVSEVLVAFLTRLATILLY